MNPIAQNIVPFELQLYHKHRTLEYLTLGCFGTCKTSCGEIGFFFTCDACRRRLTSVVSKVVEIGAGQMAESLRCFDNKKTKHVSAHWGGTSGTISPIFLV